jgi:hypothetical protein
MEVFNVTARNVGPSSTGSMGCYNDINTVAGYQYASSLMSPNLCMSQCKARGLPYAAIWDGGKSFMGHAVRSYMELTIAHHLSDLQVRHQ